MTFQSQFMRGLYVSFFYRLMFDIVLVSFFVYFFEPTFTAFVFCLMFLWSFSAFIVFKNFLFGLLFFYFLGGRRLQAKALKDELRRLNIYFSDRVFLSGKEAIDEFVSDEKNPANARISAARFAGALDCNAAQGGLRSVTQAVALEDAIEAYVTELPK